MRSKKPAKSEASNVEYLPGTEIAFLPGLKPLLVPVEEVKPDPKNPRRQLQLEQLVKSLQRFGLRKPIVANSRDHLVEAGHQTYAALVQLGATHVPVLWAEDNRVDAAAYNIADNRTGETVAEWDEKLLSDLLAELRGEDNSLIESIGYTQTQADSIIATFQHQNFGSEERLPPTPFDGSGETLLNGRVILVYETPEQKQWLAKRLGLKLHKVTYHVTEMPNYASK